MATGTNHNSQSSILNSQLNEFDEIRPYEPSEMKQAFEDLINDRQFSLVLKGFAPWLPRWARNGLLRLAFIGVKTPLDFQKRFMKPVVNWIVRKHTDGLTFDDNALKIDNGELKIENYDLSHGGDVADKPGMQGNHNSQFSTLNSQFDSRYTFVSNHRDIVLDSAFLDVLLVGGGYPTTVEIGIGDNLLIYPWIKRLVRMNKAFTVRRGLTAHEMMRSSQLMSRYIHYAVTQKHENIWIAQREGRAKDSDDRTQDSVLKMLAMGGPSLKELNIVPLTISYQFDPCDYLKAQEMQLKRDNPAFKKSRQDDLDNMRTGIFGWKGEVVYRCGTPVNAWIDELEGLPKNEFFSSLSHRIDREIHAGYELFYTNYLALDMLEGGEQYCRMYYGERCNSKEIDEIKKSFEQYVQGQIDKINIPDKDEAFLRECILNMYANPLRNYLAAKR